MGNYHDHGPTLQLLAHVSSWCAIVMLFLKRDQNSAKGIARMLPVGWTRAIYYDSPLGPALIELAILFDNVCWTH